MRESACDNIVSKRGDIETTLSKFAFLLNEILHTRRFSQVSCVIFSWRSKLHPACAGSHEFVQRLSGKSSVVRRSIKIRQKNCPAFELSDRVLRAE
jgi:hypothetical protein